MFSHSIKSRIVLLQNGKTSEDKIVYLVIGRRLLYNCTVAIICFLPKYSITLAGKIIDFCYNFTAARLFNTARLLFLLVFTSASPCIYFDT